MMLRITGHRERQTKGICLRKRRLREISSTGHRGTQYANATFCMLFFEWISAISRAEQASGNAGD
jgi:hypothetical protein